MYTKRQQKIVDALERAIMAHEIAEGFHWRDGLLIYPLEPSEEYKKLREALALASEEFGSQRSTIESVVWFCDYCQVVHHEGETCAKPAEPLPASPADGELLKLCDKMLQAFDNEHSMNTMEEAHDSVSIARALKSRLLSQPAVEVPEDARSAFEKYAMENIGQPNLCGGK